MNGVLFDQNLPARLTFVPSLSLIHATALGQSPGDSQIWLYAKTHDLVMVTKDADFRAVSSSRNHRLAWFICASEIFAAPIFIPVWRRSGRKSSDCCPTIN